MSERRRAAGGLALAVLLAIAGVASAQTAPAPPIAVPGTVGDADFEASR